MEEVFNNLPDQEEHAPAESPVPTRFAVRCPCNSMNLVFMTFEFYMAQMEQGHRTWICPRCFSVDYHPYWDDENYEQEFEDEEQLCPIED